MKIEIVEAGKYNRWTFDMPAVPRNSERLWLGNRTYQVTGVEWYPSEDADSTEVEITVIEL